MYVVFPILTEPSLSLSNLTSTLDSLPNTLWRRFGGLMNVPPSTLNKIQSQFHTERERKTEVLCVCSTEHPQPTWEQVSDVLYQLRDGKYHSVLERVQSQFPTGEYLSVTSHTSHHNLPLTLLTIISHVIQVFAESDVEWLCKRCSACNMY